MNLHIQANGEAVTPVPPVPVEHPNFSQAQPLVPLILGSLVLMRKIPSKYAFMIGSSFAENPVAFEEVYADKMSKHQKELGPLDGTPKIMCQAMVTQQILCQAIETSLFYIADKIVDKYEEHNFWDKLMVTELHAKFIAEAYSEKKITTEEAEDLVIAFANFKPGFNIYCSTFIEKEYLENKDFKLTDEFFEHMVKTVVEELIKTEKQEKIIRQQNEAFSKMMMEMNPDGTPVNPEEFEKALKEAGFVPAKTDVVGNMTDIANIPD